MTNDCSRLASPWSQLTGLDQLLYALPQRSEPMPLPPPKGEITVDALVVVPPGAPGPVLEGISLRVEAGNHLAIIGPSAAVVSLFSS